VVVADLRGAVPASDFGLAAELEYPGQAEVKVGELAAAFEIATMRSVAAPELQMA
jgi:hypothetical protein